MEIFLELQTSEPDELRENIAGEQSVLPETGVAINDQLSLRFAGVERQRAVDATALVIFALTFPMGIATNVVADLISDFLRSRRTRSHAERAFLVIEEEVESIDADGKHTTRTTSKREEILLD